MLDTNGFAIFCALAMALYRPLTSHDQLAKELFKTFFADLVRLTAPEMAAQLRLDALESTASG